MAMIAVSQIKAVATVPSKLSMSLRFSLLPPIVTNMLQNLIVGSNYYISRQSDDLVLAQGIAITDMIMFSMEFYGIVPINIRVRKSAYLPYETQGLITSTGLSVWVVQEIDPNYGI